MPRGRHRQSSPLSRLLPPLACGVLAVASLTAAAFTTDAAVLRVLVIAASVGAFAGAVLLRLREHAGELELEAEITARSRDESRFEDRAAELEFQAETAEEQVKRLERRLLAQRSQITRVEAENARLLGDRARIAAEQAQREAEAVQRREAAVHGSRPTPTLYLKAAAALRGMERRAAVDEAQRIAASATAATVHRPAAARPAAQEPSKAAAEVPGRQEPANAPQQSAFRPKPRVQPRVPATATTTAGTVAADAKAPAKAVPVKEVVQLAGHASAETVVKATGPASAAAQGKGQGPAWARAALPPLRPASAVLPISRQTSRQSRDLLRQDAGSGGTFNFFSRQETAISNDLGDLADVVGAEAAEAQQRYTGSPETTDSVTGDGLPDTVHDRASAGTGADADEAAGVVAAAGAAAGQGPERAQQVEGRAELVDLTADDETEPIDVRSLRVI